MNNRVAVSAAHHLHRIHGHRTRAGGTAPHAVRWALGLRPDRPPFLRSIGDGYLRSRTVRAPAYVGAEM